jgi:hypothetical protein
VNRNAPNFHVGRNEAPNPWPKYAAVAAAAMGVGAALTFVSGFPFLCLSVIVISASAVPFFSRTTGVARTAVQSRSSDRPRPVRAGNTFARIIQERFRR